MDAGGISITRHRVEGRRPAPTRSAPAGVTCLYIFQGRTSAGIEERITLTMTSDEDFAPALADSGGQNLLSPQQRALLDALDSRHEVLAQISGQRVWHATIPEVRCTCVCPHIAFDNLWT